MTTPPSGPSVPGQQPSSRPSGPYGGGPHGPHPTQPMPQHGHRQGQGHQSPFPPATPRTERRRGPGWASTIGIALAAALVAGGLGGASGAFLAGESEPSASASQTVDRPEGSIADIASDAVPAVLTVRAGSPGAGGTGSGWVYDDSGHIVTNNHVVDGAEQSGAKISVETHDGARHDATLVGRDVSYDLAVLKVDDLDVDPLEVGASGDVVVGDEVVAVGSPLGLGSTVTSGIVSAIERPVTAGEEGRESFISAIQTDAAINPGNSGGPLLDAAGRVVGVNSAIAQMPGQSSASGSIGVGFAIPSDVVRRTADQLIKDGKAVHPAIGVSLDRRWGGEGARVLDDAQAPDNQAVVQGGPADKAGIQAGDLIVEMDGKRISSLDQLIVRIRAKAVGDQVTLKVKRDQEEKVLTMTLEPAKEQ